MLCSMSNTAPGFPRDRVRVTLLAPAYNEEAVFDQFCTAALVQLRQDWELLIVDDGSVDRTNEIADRYKCQDHRVRVIAHAENRGLGAALATGFAEARGDVVVTMDSDLSHPFDLLPTMIAECERADVVYASRFVPGGSMVDVPWWRVIISCSANRILRLVFATITHDLTSGFRAYRSSVLRDLPIRSTSFAAQLEITVRLQAAGYRVAEVPVTLHGRAAGSSKMRYLALLPRYAAMTLWLLGVRWRHRRYPSRTARTASSDDLPRRDIEALERRDPVEDPAAP
jgi:dolichol-phosphate mannosyltransferase